MHCKTTNPMRRREFLVRSSQVALAVSQAPWVARVSRRIQPAFVDSQPSRLFGTLVAQLEDAIPKWMREANVPGLSMTIISDAKIAGAAAFGVKDAAAKSRQ